MDHCIRVVGVELVHDAYFSWVTASFDLRQLARNVGVRHAWVAPTDREMPEPLRESAQPGWVLSAD